MNDGCCGGDVTPLYSMTNSNYNPEYEKFKVKNHKLNKKKCEELCISQGKNCVAIAVKNENNLIESIHDSKLDGFKGAVDNKRMKVENPLYEDNNVCYLYTTISNTRFRVDVDAHTTECTTLQKTSNTDKISCFRKQKDCNLLNFFFVIG